MKLTLAAAAFALATCAFSQWTVVNLHPQGALSSAAYGVQGGHQAGVVEVPDPFWTQARHASLWSGTAKSWVDLEPFGDGGPEQSHAFGVYGDKQIGITESFGGGARATIWSGSAGSFEELLAPDWPTYAYAIYEDQKVGSWHDNGEYLACMWTGISNQFVDLHPAGAVRSEALGVGGSQQVGIAWVGSGWHAGLWTGTAISFVDLHPASATESLAYGVDAGQQVGSATIGGSNHASLWQGSASSWLDISPPASVESVAAAVHDGQQVGSARFGTVWRAGLWNGTASSWIDLSSFLPAGFGDSQATGISHDRALTYVVGYGMNNVTGRSEALMWVSRSVAPTSFNMFRGSVFSGNLASLQNSDNDRLVMRPGVTLGTSQPPIQVILNATAPTASPDGFSFSLESSASFGNAQQKISLYNFTTGLYEELDVRLAKTTDDTVTVTVRTNPSRFIEPGTLAIRALVSFRAVGPSLSFPWSGRIDKVWWNFPG